MGQCHDLRPFPQLSTNHAPRSRVCFVTETQSSSYTSHFSLTSDMTDQSGSARFQTLLESALQDYEKKAGVTLATCEDSITIQLEHCHSIDDITTLLQDKTQAFNDFRQRDRISKSIRATVSILTPISAVASVVNDAGLVCQKILNTCLAFLTVVFFTENTPTCESDMFCSRYPTGCMYPSLIHMSISFWHPGQSGGEWVDYELRCTRRDARINWTFHQPSQNICWDIPLYPRSGRNSGQVDGRANIHACTGDPKAQEATLAWVLPH